MKRWKKIALALVALLALTQAPFACRAFRLARLGAAVDSLNAARAAAPPEEPLEEYAGVFHVHTHLGGHSTGALEDVVRAAKAERLAFVVMTEHPSPLLDTAAATLRGAREGVLFLNGSELVAGDGSRLFVVPGYAPPGGPHPPLRELIARAKADGRLAVVGYPEEARGRAPSGHDGVEVYNLYTNSKRIRYAALLFDGLWSYWGRPELLFARFYERPAENLRRWDEYNASGAGRAYAFAGADAHANVGLALQDQAGKKLLDVRLDPYERSFRLVRTHVLLGKNEPFDEPALLAALGRGSFFLSFDVFGDPTGFRFTAAAYGGDGQVSRGFMGDEVTLPPGGDVRLGARLPVQARTVFYRDGQAVNEVRDSARAELSVRERGVYRVEVYLDRLGSLLDGRPWIISNPIFVR
ncbi:MAG TPA: hypothetical protein VF668_22240 [Pyrinomonadaceae bacterium]|jgi:hypothetical protein